VPSRSFPAWISDIRRWAWEHLGVVLLLGLLALVEWHNWKMDDDLDRVCALIGPHDVYVDHPRKPRETIDNICISHEPDDEPDGEDP
jgi:hypothetical protein